MSSLSSPKTNDSSCQESSNNDATHRTYRIEECQDRYLSLISLPQCDFGTRNGAGATSDDEDDDSPLVLMQLPDTLTLSELLSQQSDAKIVGSSHQEPSNGNVVHKKAQACLVIEAPKANDNHSKTNLGKSFGISRVDTSNALIVVPPRMIPKNVASPSGNSPTAGRKRPRAEKEYIDMAARLITPSSFLELKNHRFEPLKLHELLAADLRKHDQRFSNPYGRNRRSVTVDTTAVATIGFTVAELCGTFQCAVKEMLAALSFLKALRSTNTKEQARYSYLSEEPQQETTNAILAVITEHTEWNSHAIPRKEFCNEVLQIVGKGEESWIHDPLDVVNHCIHLLSVPSTDPETDAPAPTSSDVAQFDMEKVAIALAHELFTRNSTQRWPRDAFCTEWHLKMPGVGPQFEPSVELLLQHGVALSTISNDTNDSGESQPQLRYFPESKLPLESKLRFEKLFAVRNKWRHDDLEPYVAPLVVLEGKSLAELLLKHTVVTKDEDATQWYQSRATR